MTSWASLLPASSPPASRPHCQFVFLRSRVCYPLLSASPQTDSRQRHEYYGRSEDGRDEYSPVLFRPMALRPLTSRPARTGGEPLARLASGTNKQNHRPSMDTITRTFISGDIGKYHSAL